MITFIGTGGVGKTSLSLCFAIQAALEKKKVAAITVDPSNRLNTLLGLKQGMDTRQEVVFDNPGVSFDVFFLDTEKIFQRFVSSHTDGKFYEKLKKNSIYHQISKNLRETHNFSALYKMVEILKTESYDFIVMDTPPCHQVIEFFDSPDRLQNFFSLYEGPLSNPWLSWIKSSSLFEKTLKTLTGKKFIDNLDQFFKVIGHLNRSVHQVSRKFIETLGLDNSFLVLVFSPSPDKIESARFLQKEISKKGFKVNAWLLNRSWVDGLDSENGNFSQSSGSGHKSPKYKTDKQLRDSTGEFIKENCREESELYHFFFSQKKESLQLMRELKKKQNDPSLEFFLLPDMEMQMKNRQDVIQFSKTMRNQWQKI